MRNTKAEIRKRLKNAPKYPADCVYCGNYAATFTKPMTIVHYDCWRLFLYRQKLQKAR